MAPLKQNSNIEKRVSVVYPAAASTSDQAKAVKRSRTYHDSTDASDVPDAKRRKQTVNHHDVDSATPTAVQQNKKGVKRRVIDEDDQFPSPPTKNKMRETTATQSVAVVNSNENAASVSHGEYDTILRNLFARQLYYRKGKLCDDSKLSAYQVTKFLTAHCEKVNPTNRNSEWRLKTVAIVNGDKVDDEVDEDVPVPTTDDDTPLINPSSPVRETDEDGPVLTTVDNPRVNNSSSLVREADEDGPVLTTDDDTRLIDRSSPYRGRLENDSVPPTDAVTSIVANNNHQEDTTYKAKSTVQMMNHVATTSVTRISLSSRRNTSDCHSDSSQAADESDAKRCKQGVESAITPAAMKQNKRGVKRRVIDEDCSV